MPDLRRTTCRDNKGGCGRPSLEVGPISWRGLCESCAVRNTSRNIIAMISHDGPEFSRWRRGMAASVGAILPDDG